MNNIAPPPSSPAEWQKYANGHVVATIPSRAELSEEKDEIIQRDVYLDASLALGTPVKRLYIYTDVLAFTKRETVVTPPTYGLLQIVARVLTAATPVNLRFNTEAKSGCLVWLYGSVLDQRITVSTGASQPILLELGAESGHDGVFLTVFPDAISADYKNDFADVTKDEFRACVETQLRIALALFWRNTSIAVSLCAYVARATANPASHPDINAQAAALGQQLAAQAMAGPNMSFAPALVLDNYNATVHDALDAMAGFETQYHRFQDNKGALEIQKQAWDVMLQQATNRMVMVEFQRDSALDKYFDAYEVVSGCLERFKADIDELDRAKEAFDRGLEEWKDKQKLMAMFQIFKPWSSLVFAVGIGRLSSGNPAGISDALKAIGEAVDAVKEAERTERGAPLKSASLVTLGDCMKALETLYPAVDGVVWAVHELETNPNADIPSIVDISGTDQGDANAALIVTLAGWDRWVLESDEQMRFAVDQEIKGAGNYRLALRKHAVNGKQLAQTQAEAVKSGQEYVQSAMNVILCAKDVEALRKLRDDYTGQEKMYAQAEARFFDRFLSLRTGLVIEMRNLAWAYKYWALTDSQVVLDSQKSTADFRADLFFMNIEVQTANSRYSTDFQPFNYIVHSNDLPANYGQTVIQGLRGETHSASFTLAPDDGKAKAPNFASVFTQGSHFRLDGLEVVLRGVVPEPTAMRDGKVEVDMQIATSGLYSDIQDGQVFHFTSLPRSVRFSYCITGEGYQGETLVHASWPTTTHAKPTPFTQWTIKLHHPERLDLSGLTGVELLWTGNARFDDVNRGSKQRGRPRRRIGGGRWSRAGVLLK